MSARDKAMTDDLAQMLADIDSILETDFDTQLAVERDPYGATRAIEAALYMLRDQSARIEDLQAQTMRLSGMVHDLKKEVAISDALLISEAEVSLARLDRAETAEAERDRLREVLTALHKQALMLRGEQSYREFARAVEKQARAALKGESQ